MAELTGNEPVSTGNLKALMDWTAQGRDISVTNLQGGSSGVGMLQSDDFEKANFTDATSHTYKAVRCKRAGIYEVNASLLTGVDGKTDSFYMLCDSSKNSVRYAVTLGASDVRLVSLRIGDYIAFDSSYGFSISMSVTRLYAR